jgi:filamentous hemagglutinin family protein
MKSQHLKAADTIDNIISRVTGGDPSNIDGMIRSTIPGADLFLLNPSGFLFGPNARLNIDGSFTLATSDYISFKDENRFYSVPLQGELLSSAPISSFGFLTSEPGAITVKGPGEISAENYDGHPTGLLVTEGETISFISGGIDISSGGFVVTDIEDPFGQIRIDVEKKSGSILAPSGRINLVSVASPGEASISNDGFDVRDFEALGDIHISEKSFIDTTGKVGGGDIYIRSGKFMMSDSTLQSETRETIDGGVIDIGVDSLHFIDGAAIKASTYASGDAGDIRIDVKNEAVFEGRNAGNDMTSVQCNSANSDADAGKGGAVEISAADISLKDGAFIGSFTNGCGDGGRVTIEADNSLLIEGTGQGKANVVRSGIILSTYLDDSDGGNAGDAEIIAPSITIQNSGLIESLTYGTGDGGNIDLTTNTLQLISNARVSVECSEWSNGGNSGNVTIKTSDLTMTDGSSIRATTSGAGKAGTLDISASGTVLLEGASKEGGEATIDSASRSLQIFGNLMFNEAGQIVRFQEGQEIPPADAGSSPKDSEQLPSDPDAFPADDGIQSFEGAGGVPSNAGPAGNIYIDAGKVILKDGGTINNSSEAPNESGQSSPAGECSITAGELIISGVNPYGEYVSGYGSGIYSRSIGKRNSAGNAGTITVDAQNIAISDGGLILNDSVGSADCGSITVNVENDLTISGSGPENPPNTFGQRQLEFQEAFPESLVPITSGIYSNALADNGQGGGMGGTIAIQSSNLKLDDTAEISARSFGTGNAGNIDIRLEDSLLMENISAITTEAALAGDGIISIAANNNIDLIDSSITTSVYLGEGNGGDINIANPDFLILDRSRIQANAEAGDGGNISISSGTFIPSVDSFVEASSKTGIDGQVLIDSPDTNLSGDLAALSSHYLDASKWATTPCDQRFQKDISRFEINDAEAVFSPLSDFQEILPEFDNDGARLSEEVAGQVNKYLETGNYKGIVTVLENMPDSLLKAIRISKAYQTLGRFGDARKALDAVAPFVDESKDNGLKALYYLRSGDLHLYFQDTKQAIHDLKKGLRCAEAENDRIFAACLWNHLGILRSLNHDFYGAGKAYYESLTLLSGYDTGARLIPTVRLNLALLHLLKKDRHAAIVEAGNIIQELNKQNDGYDKARNRISLFHVVRKVLISKDKKPDTGHGAENKLWMDTGKGLENALQVGTDLNNIRLMSEASGSLGRFYEESDDIADAVTATRKAAHWAQSGTCPDLLYRWQWQLGRLYIAQGHYQKSAIAYQNAIATLNPIRMRFLRSYRMADQTFEDNVKPVYLGLAAIFLENPDLLDEARTTMELLKKAELQNYFQDECLVERKWKPLESKQVPAGTVIIYPISFPDHISLLLMFHEGMKLVNVLVKADVLAGHVVSFREKLEEKSDDVLQDATELYDLLIRPLATELESGNIHTLVVAPDGILRLIPFSALYDGNRFLVESYALSTISAANLTNTGKRLTTLQTALLSGLSEGKENFSPLTNVKKELETIGTMMSNKILLDEQFTLSNLGKEMTAADYNILHLATHATFAGRPESSFLLTYDRRLYMDELERLVGLKKYRDQPLDLLVLSACQTAMGDENAAFGLAGVALRAGAKSIVASLWETDDAATYLLVDSFYRQYSTARVTKADALQFAQLEFLNRSQFKHPGYWAAFILIGNWQ